MNISTFFLLLFVALPAAAQNSHSQDHANTQSQSGQRGCWGYHSTH